MFTLRRFIAPTCVRNITSTSAAAVAASAVAFQPARFCAAATTTVSLSSSNNNNNNNNNRQFNRNNRGNNNNSGNNMNRRGNNNSFRNQQQFHRNRTIGAVDFFDVRDSPKDGRELRLAFRHETFSSGSARYNNNNNNNNTEVYRTMTMTIRPQLGPRKTDPHDPTPQFDQHNRLTLRLKPKEVATILYWLQGRGESNSQNSVEVAGNSYKIALTRQDSGTVMVMLSGTKLDGQMSEPMGYELQPHQQVQFTSFFENSLFAFWGLPAF